MGNEDSGEGTRAWKERRPERRATTSEGERGDEDDYGEGEKKGREGGHEGERMGLNVKRRRRDDGRWRWWKGGKRTKNMQWE